MDLTDQLIMKTEYTSLELLNQTLSAGGLNNAATDEERLQQLWQLYIKSQSFIQEIAGKLDSAKEDQEKEQDEVEDYVAHVRTLYEERETLTAELEEENEQLKFQVENLQQELDGTGLAETREMLTQQGLEDIATSSSGEQVAYLLVERARLMDELDAATIDAEDKDSDDDLMDHLHELLQEHGCRNIANNSQNVGEVTYALLAERARLLRQVELQACDTQEVPSHNAESEDSKARVTEMLMQQNLDDIADSEYPDQIAFLLVERARLMDETEAMGTEAYGNNRAAPSDNGTAELEETLRQQQERGREMRERMRQSHEEEVAAIMAENDKLQTSLDATHEKIKTQDSEIRRLRSSLNSEGTTGVDQSLFDATLRETENRFTTEINQLRLQLLEKEGENQTLKAEDGSVVREESELVHQKIKSELVEVTEDRDQLVLEADRHKAHIARLQQQIQSLELESSKKDNTLSTEVQSHSSAMVQAELNLAKLQKELATARNDLMQGEQSTDLLKERQIHAEKEIAALKQTLSTERGERSDATQQLTEQLREELKRNQDLHQQLTVKEHEMVILKEQMMASNEHETRQRKQIENKNVLLEEETKKAWEQVRELSSCIHKLERSNAELQAQISMKSVSSKESEIFLMEQKQNQTAMIKAAETRADFAEKRAHDLECDMQSAFSQLQSAEHSLKEAASLRQQVHLQQQELSNLRNQLHHQHDFSVKSEASMDMSGQTSPSQIHELSLRLQQCQQREQDTQRRNSELQQLLLELERRMERMRDASLSADEKHQFAEYSDQVMTAHLAQLQQEVQVLHLELQAANEKYDLQLRKYNQRKMRVKMKMFKARELFSQDKKSLQVEHDTVLHKVLLLESSQERDAEYRRTMEASHKELITEKRDLLTKLTEQDETCRDQRRSVSMLQVKVNYLEEENKSLLTQRDSLSHQKHNVDRLLKEYQTERSKQDIYQFISPASIGYSPMTSTLNSYTNNYRPSHQLGSQPFLQSDRSHLQTRLSFGSTGSQESDLESASAIQQKYAQNEPTSLIHRQGGAALHDNDDARSESVVDL